MTEPRPEPTPSAQPAPAGFGDLSREEVLRLLGRLHLEELDRDLLEAVREVPALSREVPVLSGKVPAASSGTGDGAPEGGSDGERGRPRAGDLDPWLRELRVEHQWLFGMNVYPYESVFVGEEVMLNTPVTGRVEAFYRRCGFEPEAGLRFGAPDHFGLELLLTAELIEEGRRAEARRWIRSHPGRWGPVFAYTVARTSRRPFYRALAEVTAEFLLRAPANDGLEGRGADERRSRWEAEGLREPGVAPEAELRPGAEREPGPEREPGDEGPSRVSDPGVPGADDDRGEGPDLGAVVSTLTTPSRVGIFLTRQDIVTLSRSLDLSAGVLERSTMLKNLFRAAGQYGRVPELLDGLTVLLRQADRQYLEWGRAHEGWASRAADWRERTGAGLDLLSRMQEASGPVPGDPPEAGGP